MDFEKAMIIIDEILVLLNACFDHNTSIKSPENKSFDDFDQDTLKQIYGFILVHTTKQIRDITNDITIIVYKYLYDPIKKEMFLFNEEHEHGTFIEIINDATIRCNGIELIPVLSGRSAITRTSGTSSILFGPVISSRICQKYQIYCKINRMDRHYNLFSVGYVGDRQDVQDFNQALGEDNNKDTSIGINFDVEVGLFWMHDKDNEFEQLRDLNIANVWVPCSGSEFMFEFDFVAETFSIFAVIDGTNILKVRIKNKKNDVIVGFTLNSQDDEIEITNCKWSYKYRHYKKHTLNKY
eukprot:273729_1